LQLLHVLSRPQLRSYDPTTIPNFLLDVPRLVKEAEKELATAYERCGGLSGAVSIHVVEGIAVAMALPAALDALGVDPAFGSGPLATVVQDLLTILIYLSVAGLHVT
jgi:hypothetical protein